MNPELPGGFWTRSKSWWKAQGWQKCRGWGGATSQTSTQLRWAAERTQALPRLRPSGLSAIRLRQEIIGMNSHVKTMSGERHDMVKCRWTQTKYNIRVQGRGTQPTIWRHWAGAQVGMLSLKKPRIYWTRRHRPSAQKWTKEALVYDTTARMLNTHHQWGKDFCWMTARSSSPQLWAALEGWKFFCNRLDGADYGQVLTPWAIATWGIRAQG